MKVFHGWKMVAAGGALQFLQAAMLHHAFGAYFAALTVEKGWSRTSLSAAAAIQSTEAALVGPVLGWIIDRYGAQNLIRAGVVIMGAGFFALSQVETLPGFYGAIVLIALGSSMCGFFPINAAIIQWFEHKRARALSMVGLGLALGGLATPVVAGAMHSFGWRPTAMASGVLIIVIGWPLARVMRRRPEDYGDYVDGKAPSVALAGEAGATVPLPPEDLSVGQALRTSAFWLISIGHGLALLVVTAVNVHAITHMKEGLGYSVTQAAFFIMILTFGQVGGVLLSATIGDRFEKRLLAACCMLGHMTGLLLLTYATHPAQVAAFAALHGVAWGLRGPLMQSIRADYFGRNAIGMILGLSSVIIALGQIAGPMVAGMLADLTGNYRSGFTVLALAAGCGSLLFFFAVPPRQAATS